MTKLRCECGKLAHKRIDGKCYCKNCVSPAEAPKTKPPVEVIETVVEEVEKPKKNIWQRLGDWLEECMSNTPPGGCC
jgi:hypothetical protein